MINYIIAGIAGLIALFLFLLLIIQFWRLGQYLKLNHPISFRLYSASWVFVGMVVATGLSIGTLFWADEQQKAQKEQILKMEAADALFSSNSDHHNTTTKLANN